MALHLLIIVFFPVSVEKDDGTSVSESLQLVKTAKPGWRVVEMGLYRYYSEHMKVTVI